jgi:hypothetical protein
LISLAVNNLLVRLVEELAGCDTPHRRTILSHFVDKAVEAGWQLRLAVLGAALAAEKILEKAFWEVW